MTHVIARSCCNDAACVYACPVNCIHPTPEEPGYATTEALYIDPVGCIDCGACIDVCPVGAIYPDYDLPTDQLVFAEWNAAYYLKQSCEEMPEVTDSTRQTAAVNAGLSAAAAEAASFRVAVVGSGPSGCYAAGELLAARGREVRVDMFERLPVVGGLVRFGVAPDHQQTKTVSASFARTMSNRRFRLFANTEIGRDLGHEELTAHYDAVIYAVGAATGRSIGLPGEELPGSHTATDFVNWYNCHPDQVGTDFDFDTERAVVIGNGNVAMDVARILLSDTERLRGTDIAGHALAALANSTIREVCVVARRGPDEAAFSRAEVLGLAELGDVAIRVYGADDEIATADEASKAGYLRSVALPPGSPVPAGRSVTFAFLRSPVELVGTDRVTGIRLMTNVLERDEAGRTRAVATGEVEELACGLVLAAVGYHGAGVAGVPFDETRGVIPNAAGRVLDPATGSPAVGLYTTGWVKRGPSGVVGTNKWCARETVTAIFTDLEAGLLGRVNDQDVAELLPAAVDLSAWRAIDARERALGQADGRPRVKLARIEEMLAATVD